MTRYGVSIKATVEDLLIVEAESEMDACDKAAYLFHNEHAALDAEITDVYASEADAK